jgi:glutamate racemase
LSFDITPKGLLFVIWYLSFVIFRDGGPIMKNGPIGIFDSGVGGLTVFKEIEKALPHEDLIYFGDTAHVPYGSKSKETVIKFSTNNILFLLQKKVKIVVVACNTASALALDHLKNIFSVPILGVIEAGANKALQVSKNNKIGVIGTKATVKSQSYEKEIFKKDKSVKVYSESCPLFVPMVEDGMLSGKLVDSIVEMYLNNFKRKGIDTLVLGCTHYPLLKSRIAAYLKGVHIIDSAEEVAFYTKIVLMERGLLNPSQKKSKKEFYVTDEPTGFGNLAKLFLREDIKAPRVVNV